MGGLNTRLFEMDWHICEDGYEIIKRNKETLEIDTAVSMAIGLRSSNYWIRPKSKNIKKYQPLKSYIGLARRCSDIAKSDNIHDEMLNFANKFGLMGFSAFINDKETEEPLEIWKVFIDNLNLVYKFHDTQHIRGNLDKALTCYNGNQQWLSMRSTVKWDEKPTLRMLELRPSNLVSLIWLLLSEELTAGLDLKKCSSPKCQQWFPNKNNKQYCNVNCRVYGNRHKNEIAS